MQMSSVAKATASKTDEQWRLLAQRIERERDPAKVIKLAHQLIAEFDRARPNAKDSRQRLAS
jgi:hypothetical protein